MTLGHFFRRIESRRGTAVAVVATAHKLARILYFMLKKQTDFVPPDLKEIQERSRKRDLRRLQRLADKVGAQVLLPHP